MSICALFLLLLYLNNWRSRHCRAKETSSTLVSRTYCSTTGPTGTSGLHSRLTRRVRPRLEAELSNWNMDNMAPKLKIFTTWPFKEKVYIPDDPEKNKVSGWHCLGKKEKLKFYLPLHLMSHFSFPPYFFFLPFSFSPSFPSFLTACLPFFFPLLLFWDERGLLVSSFLCMKRTLNSRDWNWEWPWRDNHFPAAIFVLACFTL